MKKTLVAVTMAALFAVVGCDKGTTGGTVKEKEKDKGSVLKDKVGQADDTFKLSVPSITLKQGEEKSETIKITRGNNFTEDVALKFEGMPTGVTVDPAAPMLKKSETEVKVTIKAAADAAVGSSNVTVIGHPSKGPDDSTNKMTVKVEKK